jgi:hypothetical protein
MTKLRNWTTLVFLFPRHYADESLKHVDIEHWSDEYEWRQDPWNGIKDFMRPPAETLEHASGDCEDYAMVVVSHHVANDIPVWVAVCWVEGDIIPSHFVAYDEDNVYSSGTIYEDTTLEEYLPQEEYKRTLSRRV